MNFLKQFLKLGSLVLVVALIMVSAVSYSFKNKKAENAFAGTGENMSGYAWSENIGWVSFNNTTGGGGTSYGVNIQETDISGGNTIGELSGYAWSENIGWITFNRDNANTPPAGQPDPGLTYDTLAYIDTNGETIKGWARAMSACDDANSDGKCDSSGAGTNSGGWDGWIALGDMNTGDSKNYGVSLDLTTKQFKGWAWGSDSAGWISFNNITGGGSTPYSVSTTFELNKTPDVVTAGNMDIKTNPNSSYCGAGSITFEWKFSDPNLDTPNNQMSKYKLEASYTNSNFKIIRETTTTANNNTIISVTVPLSEIKSDLDGNNWYNQTLYWKVTVYDGGFGNKSATSETDSYNLPDNEYVVDFNSNPPFNNIFAEQVVQFFDKSKVYNSSNPNGKDLNMDNVTTACGSNCSRTWDFSSNGNPTTSTRANPTAMFIEDIATDVKLTFGDKDRYGASYSCSKSESVAVKFPIPKFEEKK